MESQKRPRGAQKGARNAAKPKNELKSSMISFRLRAEDKGLMIKAAGDEKLNDWALEILLAAAKQRLA